MTDCIYKRFMPAPEGKSEPLVDAKIKPPRSQVDIDEQFFIMIKDVIEKIMKELNKVPQPVLFDVDLYLDTNTMVLRWEYYRKILKAIKTIQKGYNPNGYTFTMAMEDYDKFRQRKKRS